MTRQARRLIAAGLAAAAVGCGGQAPAPPAPPSGPAATPGNDPSSVVVEAATRAPLDTAIPPNAGAPTNPAAVAGNPIAGNPVPMETVQLRIPDLGVRAPVVDVGVEPDGQMEIPADPQVLGRWAGGAAAGEPFGSLVIIGHVDTAAAGPGALFSVRELRAGALITAADPGGRTVTYRVSELRQVVKDDLVTTTDPFRQDVGHRLVLISCGGPFDRRTRHYRDNVVVFAEVVARA